MKGTGAAPGPAVRTSPASSYHIYAEMNMKKSKFLLLILTIALAASLLAAPALAVEQPTVSSAAAILMDTDSGFLYFEQNADEQLHPASTTKIMTALLVIEAVEAGQYTLDDTVVAYDDCQQGMDEDSSNANPAIEPGEILSVRDLLYCAMLASANEACNILAEYTSGSISAFVELMNERAAELGCTNTHFANPNGLENSNHYSTARDLALIAQEAVSHEQFVTLCSAASYTFGATNLHDVRTLTNTNRLVNPDSSYYDSDVYGVKTGYFEAAGGCLVSAIERDDIDLIAVILGGEIGDDVDTRYDDTVTLFNWLYDNYSYQQVLSSTDSVIKVPVTLATSDTVSGRPDTSINVLLPNDFDLDSVEYEYVIYSERDGDPLVAPVSAGTILGEVTVSADGRVFGTVNIVATSTAELSKSVYLSNSVKSILQQPVIHKLLVILIIVVALYLILSFFYVVQHSRHRRSLRRARQARAERLAMHENFPDAIADTDEASDEYDDDATPVRDFFARLIENVRARIDAARGDDYDDYDDEYDDETDDAYHR